MVSELPDLLSACRTAFQVELRSLFEVVVRDSLPRVREEVRAIIREEVAPVIGRGPLDDSLMTVAEVAEHCRAKAATVRTWIQRGELNASRVARTYRVRRSDLTNFLAKQEARPEMKDIDEVVARVLRGPRQPRSK